MNNQIRTFIYLMLGLLLGQLLHTMWDTKEFIKLLIVWVFCLVLYLADKDT